MATSIRLKRVGAKKEATFRIVVMDSRTGTSGSSVERLGIYNPRTSPSLIRLNAARTLYWLREGATPSDTVRSLLRQTGLWEQFSRGVTPEELEEPVIELGPAAGERHTSQRPAPVEKAVRGGASQATPGATTAAATAATAAAPTAAPAADVESEAEEVAVAEEPAAEAETEEAAVAEEPAAEAESEEPVAEADEEPAAAEASEDVAEDEDEEKE